MREHRRTVNIHCGKKLSGKSRDEVLTAVLAKFPNVVAVQQCLDVIRVTFKEEELALSALKEKGVRLFDMWCRMDGGPPTTILHLFDYPYEEPAEEISSFFSDCGVVKSVRDQRYLNNNDIATGTRLVDIVLSKPPPRVALINGFPCRVWYRGQPVMCNICAVLGHKSINCPYKNKCRLCEQDGHFARNCPNPWGSRNGTPAAAPGPPRASGSTAPADVDTQEGGTGAPVGASSGGEAGPSGPPESSVSVDPESPVGASSAPDPVAPVGASPGEDPVSLPPSNQSSGVSFESTADPSVSEEFHDASDGSDIGEFTDSGSLPPSSQSISDVSQASQSILQNVSIVQDGSVQNNSDKVISDVIEVIEESNCSSAADVDSMDPSLVSLKRKTASSSDRHKSRSRSSGSRSKHKRVVSASPRGRHAGLPSVAKDHP